MRFSLITEIEPSNKVKLSKPMKCSPRKSILKKISRYEKKGLSESEIAHRMWEAILAGYVNTRIEARRRTILRTDDVSRINKAIERGLVVKRRATYDSQSLKTNPNKAI